jgi:membrane-bound lytic murein transglycosylase D
MCLRATIKILLLISLNSIIFFNISNASPTKSSFLLRLVEQYPQCLKNYCHSSNENNLDNPRSRSYLRLIESGIPLLQYYVDALKSENLPIYYAVIPLLESGNIPLAESPAGAKGLWQLMPATAHDMGAFRNYQNDFRSDIYISTKAAVRFLRELHGKYRGNHELVLAAYNWGPANVDRYLLRNNNEASSIYSNLPEETKRYLQNFYKIGEDLRGLNSANPLWKYPDVHYLKTIRSNDAEVQSGGAQADLFNFLNPNYSGREHWVVPTEFFYSYFGKSLTRSKRPLTSISKVNNTLECFKDSPGKGSSYFYAYITRHGDSVSSIARKFSLSKDEVARLSKSHPQIESGMVIKLSKQPDNQGRQICLN